MNEREERKGGGRQLFQRLGAHVHLLTPTYALFPEIALAIFGVSITTDHISPAGAIKATSPAGAHLRERGVAAVDFNSYAADVRSAHAAHAGA